MQDRGGAITSPSASKTEKSPNNHHPPVKLKNLQMTFIIRQLN
jgi:hypothetical protein